ncbi:hypothetical protein ACIBCR_15240 [Micromonospora echinospora]|uniref:hypothetical protein n=1 Tax=Micromonospora echinospora TaxID=1877 RepID=UPI0037BA651E
MTDTRVTVTPQRQPTTGTAGTSVTGADRHHASDAATVTRTVTATASPDTTDADATVTRHHRHPDTITHGGVTVIDATDVRRDWRHHATTLTATAFVAVSATALYTAHFHHHPHLAWVLAALALLLAIPLTALTHHTRQAGRRLTWSNPR